LECQTAPVQTSKLRLQSRRWCEIIEMAATHCLFQIETDVGPFVAGPSVRYFIKALVDFQQTACHFCFCCNISESFSRVVSIHKTMHFNLFVKLQREACNGEKKAEDKAKI